MSYSNLERVAENLMRDPSTLKYYARKKIGGRRVIHCLQTTDRQTADGKLANWRSEKADLDVGAADLKIGGLIEKYLGTRRGAADVASDDSRAKIFRATFRRGLGAKVSAIRTSDLKDWIEREAAARKWKGRTFNHVRLFLKGMFDLAVADRVLSEGQNPFKPKIIKRRKPDPVHRRIPTLAQFAQILAYAGRGKGEGSGKRSGSTEARQFLSLLGNAGIGQAEASGMRVRDLGATHLFFIRQKTKKQFRVPIYPWLRDLVAELRAKHANSGADEHVFTILDVKTPLASACRNLGLPRFTQRNLRAMLIKRLHDMKIPAKQIALWQGHTDGGVLIQTIYTEVFCDSDAAGERAYLDSLEAAPGKVLQFDAAIAA
jgi:hypothetical protein